MKLPHTCAVACRPGAVITRTPAMSFDAPAHQVAAKVADKLALLEADSDADPMPIG